MNTDQHELIDFGDGRKLERFADRLVDRPSPAAEDLPRLCPQAWPDADSVFDEGSKTWLHRNPWPNDLTVRCDGFRMPVRPTPFGHVGLFPEQADNWLWLQSDVVPSGATRHALNLFAYCGASTMALVAAGYEVAHVDAAKPNVTAAREAARCNDWSDAPIRYLVDDAAKFTAREVRRGRRYHTIVLDPPTYGHTPQGKAWRIERDLWPLLEDCLRLVEPSRFRLLITGHSTQIDQTDVADFFQQTSAIDSQSRGSALHIDAGRSQLKDRGGRYLDAGFFVRVSTPSGSTNDTNQP